MSASAGRGGGRGSCCWPARGIALWMIKQTRGCCEVIWSFPLPLGGIVPALNYVYRPPAEEIAQAPSVSHACVLRPSRSVSFLWCLTQIPFVKVLNPFSLEILFCVVHFCSNLAQCLAHSKCSLSKCWMNVWCSEEEESWRQLRVLLSLFVWVRKDSLKVRRDLI